MTEKKHIIYVFLMSKEQKQKQKYSDIFWFFMFFFSYKVTGCCTKKNIYVFLSLFLFFLCRLSTYPRMCNSVFFHMKKILIMFFLTLSTCGTYVTENIKKTEKLISVLLMFFYTFCTCSMYFFCFFFTVSVSHK